MLFSFAFSFRLCIARRVIVITPYFHVQRKFNEIDSREWQRQSQDMHTVHFFAESYHRITGLSRWHNVNVASEFISVIELRQRQQQQRRWRHISSSNVEKDFLQCKYMNLKYKLPSFMHALFYRCASAIETLNNENKCAHSPELYDYVILEIDELL